MPIFIKNIFYSLVLGFLIGVSAALFVNSLNWITHFRFSYQYILCLMPVIGCVIVFIYSKLNPDWNNGIALIFKSIEAQKNKNHVLLAPVIYLTTLASHWVGASVGREGTALQIGSSINSGLSHFFNFNELEKKRAVILSVAASFSAVFGTPLAGAIFAIEVFTPKKLKLKLLIPSIIIAFWSNFVANFFQINHSVYFVKSHLLFNHLVVFKLIVLGCIFGLVAILYVFFFEKFIYLVQFIKNLYLRIILGSFILLALYVVLGTNNFQGLGISVIQGAFVQPADWNLFLLKLLATTFSIAIGFKGGEATPIFFIGATLGSFVGYYLGLPIDVSASLGFIAIFAALTHSPIACILLGVEIFGLSLVEPFVITTSIAYFVMNNKSIYSFYNINNSFFNKWKLINLKSKYF